MLSYNLDNKYISKKSFKIIFQLQVDIYMPHLGNDQLFYKLK